MKITWYGTASVGIETKETRLIFDPYFPMSGSNVPTSTEEFDDYRNIFITHGHLDHLSCVPELVRMNEAHVWCSETPAQTLLKKGLRDSDITLIYPGDTFQICDAFVTVFRGKHIVRDLKITRRTLFNTRVIKFGRNAVQLAKENLEYPENNETVGFLVESDGKSVFILGSLGLDYTEVYPTDVDILVMPYQGATNLAMPAMNVVRTIRPNQVMLDHFDDTFPPVSNTIDTSGVEEIFAGRISMIKPEIGKEFIV